MPKYTRLTQLERDRISTMLAVNHTYSTIAEVLGRSVSTIGREDYRNHLSVHIPTNQRHKSS
jgi:IS30 family transposase